LDSDSTRIGADIEKVERRSQGFVEDYFTPRERDQVLAASPAARDTLTTLIWSAKEAALKALRLGLTVDTRSVSCIPSAFAHIQPDWAPLRVNCGPDLPGERGQITSGWWRLWNGYVLTLALARVTPEGSCRPPASLAPRQLGTEE
jgi:4'-phosphopantetheinyl transferase